MRVSRLARSRLRLGLLLIGSLLAQACATGRILTPGVPPELEPHEGILVLHLDSDTEVRKIDLGFAKITTRLEPGRHLLLYALPEGRYAWSEVVTEGWAPGHDIHFSFAREARMYFDVKAGYVNLAGLLELGRTGIWWMRARNIDRTAWTLEQLQEEFPLVLARYPVRYGGTAHHVFLERLEAARAARSGDREAKLETPATGAVP